MKVAETFDISKKSARKLRDGLDALSNWDTSDPLGYIQKIYSVADYYYRKEVAPIAVCKADGNCNHCCKVKVEVSALEAWYINNQTGRPMARLYRSQAAPIVNETCTFLGEDGLCSIYQYRPLNCRVFASIDSVEACERADVEHMIYTTESNAGINTLLAMLMKASEGHGIAQHADIREWFPPK